MTMALLFTLSLGLIKTLLWTAFIKIPREITGCIYTKMILHLFLLENGVALWQKDGKFVGLDHEIPLGSNGISLSEY